MNIKEAKQEIKNTVKAYLAKDENGEYRIPQIRQRPMLLIGPPGIGKTQIMDQIARECEIGLVAYTITHHTRQSAVGLPFIKEAEYDGKTYSITEYTMSEIIASIYEKMKETGLREGILFIDEINCVSETLAPTMLQFLQNKTFGNQAVPKGWVIVAAGNPPEYNKSVREFDMVTLDRVRYLAVDADYEVWKEYARGMQIDQAILSYLELHPNHFYKVETDVDGMHFVTARGWEDLSNLMTAYAQLQIPITEQSVGQFLRHPEIAEDVSAYFDLYHKYEDAYQISEILAGKVASHIYARIMDAAFDERITVVNLLLHGLTTLFAKAAEVSKELTLWYDFLKNYRMELNETADACESYQILESRFEEQFEEREASGLLLPEQIYRQRAVQKRIAEAGAKLKLEQGLEPKQAFAIATEEFEQRKEEMLTLEKGAAEALDHAFAFMESAFEEDQEMLVFVTELTVTPEISSYLQEHVCEKYEMYNEKLLVGSNRALLLKELARDENLNAR